MVSRASWRPELLFIGLGCVIILALVWAIIDAPQDTGRRVHATILTCSGASARSTAPRRCAVRLGSGGQLLVDLPQGRLDQGVTLALTVRRVSRRVIYVPERYDAR